MRRSVAAAFPEWRDWLMLAALAALAAGLARAQGSQALLSDSRVAVSLGGVVGWNAARAVGRRLAWHRAEGVLAAEALEARHARGFVVAGLVLGVAALFIAGLAVRTDALPMLLFGDAVGALAGVAMPRAGRVRMRRFVPPPASATPLQTVAGTQMPFGWSPAGAAALLALALTSGITAWRAGAWAPFVLAAGAGIPLLVFGRVDHALVRFLALSGYSANRSALLHLGASGVYLAVIAAVAAAIDWRGLVAVLSVGLGFGCYTVLRVWAYRARTHRSADTMLALMLAGAGLAAALMPPLLILLVPYLGLRLYRPAAAATWSMA